VVGRWIEVHDRGDVVDMDAAGCDIGGHERAHVAAAERVECPVALLLTAAAVDRRGVDSELPELGGELVRTAARPTEEERRRDRRRDIRGVLDPVVARHVPEQMPGVGGVGLGAPDVVTHTVEPELGDQLGDRTVEGGREQHRLLPVPRGLQDAAHRGQEAHVGHLVGLVHDEHLDLVEAERALGEEVLEAARTGDDDVGAPVERPALRVVPDAAEDRGDLVSVPLGEGLQGVGDLTRELARRCNDETGGRAPARVADVRREGEAERQGLAGARRAPSGDVTAGERVGQDRGLDRERLLGADATQVGQVTRGDAEIGERGGWL
jgi:hypothetical protein